MWFAKNNLAKVFREDSSAHRTYIQVDSPQYQQKYGNQDYENGIRQAYYVNISDSNNNFNNSINKSNKSQSQQLFITTKSKGGPQSSFSNLKESSLIKNNDDLSEINPQTQNNISSMDQIKGQRYQKSFNHLDSQEDQIDSQLSQNSGLLKSKDLGKGKLAHQVLTSDSQIITLPSKSINFRSHLNQQNIKNFSNIRKKKNLFSETNLQINSDMDRLKRSSDIVVGGSISNSSRFATEEKQNNSSRYNQFYNSHMKTEESTPKNSSNPLLFSTSRNSLDNLHFSKYIHFVEFKRDKNIKNIIEKEIEIKENESERKQIQLPSIRKSNLLTPRANPYYPNRLQPKSEDKKSFSSFSEALQKKVPKINIEQLSQAFQETKGSQQALKSSEKSNKLTITPPQDSLRSKQSLQKVSEQKPIIGFQMSLSNLDNLRKTFENPINSDSRDNKIFNNNLQPINRKTISRSTSPQYQNQKNSINNQTQQIQNSKKKLFDPLESKKALQREKQDQIQQKVNKLREIIQQSDAIKRDITEISDYLQYLLSQTDISKKQIKKQLAHILSNKQHFLDVLTEENLQIENASTIYFCQLIMQGITSDKFLTLNISKDDILKEVIIPDLYIFKEKLSEFCKSRQENLLKNFKDSILQEQTSIHYLELNRFYQSQKKATEKNQKTNLVHTNQLLSDLIYPSEPLQTLDSIERKLGSFNLVKHSGRIYSHQITNALHTLKERKNLQLQQFDKQRLNNLKKENNN